jgi:hypothetical protein
MLEIKGWKNTYQTSKYSPKNTSKIGRNRLLSVKVDLRSEKIIRDKSECYTMIK